MPPVLKMKAGRPARAAMIAALACAALSGACGGRDGSSSSAGDRTSGPRPSILLVTLDTTRADAVGPEARGIGTPAFNAVAARGRRFVQAYATVPETLPSHISIMTGLYPAGHGIHENARYLSAAYPVLADRLRQTGYRTAAFVSSFILSRRFGIARGFDAYDDEMPNGRVERSAKETTDRALAYLERSTGPQPLLLWVHYFDAHAPYDPPEPFRSRFPKQPYLGEVAAVDEQLGRLVEAFERRAGAPVAIVIAGDHGEGLGDHGESTHGNLLYQSTMHVPLVLEGPGVTTGISDTPVSIRRIFHTVLDWAGLDATDSLRGTEHGVVLAEAMKPFLEFGWQPQTMLVDGRRKAILSGRFEIYDVVADPAESRDLASGESLPATARQAIEDYPVPSPDVARSPAALSDADRQKLASLGYVSAGAAPAVRRDAPRPADMVQLFEAIEQASTLFVRQDYARVIPLLERILKADPWNLDATLRLATAHSSLGHDALALEAFRRAAEIAPKSQDVRTYLALHYARGRDWARAVPLLDAIVAESPERLPAVEALAALRERQGRAAEAIELLQRVYQLRTPSPAESIRLGDLAMSAQQTVVAIGAFERARAAQGPAFARNLELGVLYLAAKRFDEARDALDRVPVSHPDYPMALFKRAQVSVLLNEPDRAARIDLARRRADATTRPLIANERLFQGIK